MVLIETNKETAWARWQAVGVQHRLVGLFSIILLIFAASIGARPDTGMSRFWLETYGFHADFMMWLFIVSSFATAGAWYFWRTLFAISLGSAPIFIIVILLLMQLAQSETAPLVTGAMGISVLILSVVTFNFAREVELYKAIALDCVQKEQAIQQASE